MIGYSGEGRALESRAASEPFDYASDSPTTFTDTLKAAWSLTRREELADSAMRAYGAGNEKRAKVIGELGGDPAVAEYYAMIPKSVTAYIAKELAEGKPKEKTLYRTLDPMKRASFDLVQEFSARYPDKVLSDAALFEQFKKEASELRPREQDTMQRGSGLASFLGQGGAIMTDPLVLATLPLGGWEGVAGRGILATAGRTAAIEGGIAVATEIPIQAQVLRFKRDLEAPWTFKDSAMNVLSAGLGGAAIGGVVGGGAAGAKRLLERYRDAQAQGLAPTREMQDAARALEDTVQLHEENPLAAGPAREPVHEQALETARTQQELGQPVNVADEVAGLEPVDEMDRVGRRVNQPSELIDIDPLTLKTDARTFQFKTGADTEGVTGALKDVNQFDRRLAGVTLVWERADGAQFIADGHQRLGLAKRAIAAGQDQAEVRLNGFVLRETDGITATDARRIAAVKNMAEGSGSPLDAAKILRDVGKFGETLLPPLPPRSTLVRQARGLAQLDEEAFLAVVNGVVPEHYGALVGAATADPKLQQAMIEVLRRAEPANETQARSIVEQVRTQGVETRTTEDLFGEQTFSESLYLERAQVLDEALRAAKKDQAVFGRLVAEEGRIETTGQNRLDREANMARVQESKDASTQLTTLANAKGPLSDALSDAARRVREGEQPGRAAAAFLKAARRAILEGDRTGGEAGRARPGDQAPRTGTALEAPQPAIGSPVRLADLPENLREETARAFLTRQSGQTIEDLYQVAERHQAALAKAGEAIAADLGEDIVLANPGVKKQARTAAKLEAKGKKAGELTDVVRLGFMVRTPELAVEVLRRLGQQFEVLDEGVSVTGMGYLDHKALVRFGDGRVGEIQLWDPELARAKFGEGHQLYEQARTINPEDLARDPALRKMREQITEASKDLYATALAAASPEWRRVAMMMLPEDMRARVQTVLDGGGSDGAAGNLSKNVFRDSSVPDSRISTEETRLQASEPSGTNKPSSPPAGVSRIAAGRRSQLKNRSAIDAPPRSIVRQAADERMGTPDVSRTGTVPDQEYQAVMAQLEDLAEARGQFAHVADEVNGQVQVRAARNVIEELDLQEETLERIRLCSAPTREVA